MVRLEYPREQNSGYPLHGCELTTGAIDVVVAGAVGEVVPLAMLLLVVPPPPPPPVTVRKVNEVVAIGTTGGPPVVLFAVPLRGGDDDGNPVELARGGVDRSLMVTVEVMERYVPVGEAGSLVVSPPPPKVRLVSTETFGSGVGCGGGCCCIEEELTATSRGAAGASLGALLD